MHNIHLFIYGSGSLETEKWKSSKRLTFRLLESYSKIDGFTEFVTDFRGSIRENAILELSFFPCLKNYNSQSLIFKISEFCAVYVFQYFK